jgi:hypothetical protein
MNAAFNCRLSLPRIFEAPTIRQMARLVEVSRDESAMPTIKSRSIPDSILDVNRLSEQDVDALLSELLADDPPGK